VFFFFLLCCPSSYKANKMSLVVLDPQWLTKVMAQVITTKKLFVKDGIMEHRHLGFMWKAPDYPSFLHAPLLSLLQSFEVMFRLEGGADPLAGRSLIPVLLPPRAKEDVLRLSKAAEYEKQENGGVLLILKLIWSVTRCLLAETLFLSSCLLVFLPV
jgi:hypothetical protein